MASNLGQQCLKERPHLSGIGGLSAAVIRWQGAAHRIGNVEHRSGGGASDLLIGGFLVGTSGTGGIVSHGVVTLGGRFHVETRWSA